MRPLLPLLATAALAAGLTVATAPASAAAATCQGVPATITASGVTRVDGTEGNDVVVADDVRGIYALGGDDLICFTGTVSTFVDAGAGNDVVDASGSAGGASAYLGEGDDTYLGSAAVDSVNAGAPDRSDSGRDVVDTGPRGQDFDFVSSGQPGLPNADQITGSWLTLVWAGTPTSESSADAGKDSLFSTGDRDTRRLTIDAKAGTYTSGSAPALELRGFTSFSVRAFPDLERFTFRGTDRDEKLDLSRSKSRPVVRIAMGGGADKLTVGTYARGSRLSGGDGRDYIDVLATSHLDLDLQRETLTKGTGRKAVTYEANSFESAFVRASTARLIGTNGPNRLSTDACSTRIEGLGGRDKLFGFNETGYDVAGHKCKGQDKVTAQLYGGPGNDLLHGSRAKDLLIGGPGRDRADGSRGRDTCEAEVRTSCEVVRR